MELKIEVDGGTDLVGVDRPYMNLFIGLHLAQFPLST